MGTARPALQASRLTFVGRPMTRPSGAGLRERPAPWASGNGLGIRRLRRESGLERVDSRAGVTLLAIVKDASCATTWPLWDKQCRMSFDSWSDAQARHPIKAIAATRRHWWPRAATGGTQTEIRNERYRARSFRSCHTNPIARRRRLLVIFWTRSSGPCGRLQWDQGIM